MMAVGPLRAHLLQYGENVGPRDTSRQCGARYKRGGGGVSDLAKYWMS